MKKRPCSIVVSTKQLYMFISSGKLCAKHLLLSYNREDIHSKLLWLREDIRDKLLWLTKDTYMGLWQTTSYFFVNNPQNFVGFGQLCVFPWAGTSLTGLFPHLSSGHLSYSLVGTDWCFLRECSLHINWFFILAGWICFIVTTGMEMINTITSFS